MARWCEPAIGNERDALAEPVQLKWSGLSTRRFERVEANARHQGHFQHEMPRLHASQYAGILQDHPA
jgi:hypothetical protein